MSIMGWPAKGGHVFPSLWCILRQTTTQKGRFHETIKNDEMLSQITQGTKGTSSLLTQFVAEEFLLVAQLYSGKRHVAQ